ncbi:MAG: hypothetical protein KDA21_05090, partial [Phycisphaerales bacterium]|nr:hypothetical protein [Phycisphaerales bacterium]
LPAAERAEALAADLSDTVNTLPWTDRPGGADIIVNATPVGMNRQDDPGAAARSPLDNTHLDALPDSATVFDTVYTPLETTLLKGARRRGIRAVTGADMFVQQAAAQFSAWTGLPPERTPTALFERIVLETRD